MRGERGLTLFKHLHQVFIITIDKDRSIVSKKEIIECDMVLLAMGFIKPEQPKFADNVFVAGDAASGASLVVRAIASGRKVSDQIDAYFSKK